MPEPPEADSPSGGQPDAGDQPPELSSSRELEEVEEFLEETGLIDIVDPETIIGKPKVLRRLSSYFFSGPLPPPRLFAEYEQVCSGASNRILCMAEEQGAHRRAMQVRDQALFEIDLRASTARATRGQYMAFAVVLVFAVSGLVMVFLDKWWGASFMLPALAQLASVFLRSRETAESEDKRPEPAKP